MDMSFIERPTSICEGTVLEIRIAYDEYGIVGIQQAPLDDKEFDTKQAIMVLEAALSVLKADQVIERPDYYVYFNPRSREVEVGSIIGMPSFKLSEDDTLVDVCRLSNRELKEWVRTEHLALLQQHGLV